MKLLNPNHEFLPIQPDHMHASFKPVSEMIVESSYYAHALLSNSFFIVFLVQGIKEKMHTKPNKDISITEEVAQ